MTIRVVPFEFAMLLLVPGLRKGACAATSCNKRLSVADEGGPQFTRFLKGICK